jgi:hypothetical protein
MLQRKMFKMFQVTFNEEFMAGNVTKIRFLPQASCPRSMAFLNLCFKVDK